MKYPFTDKFTHLSIYLASKYFAYLLGVFFKFFCVTWNLWSISCPYNCVFNQYPQLTEQILKLYQWICPANTHPFGIWNIALCDKIFSSIYLYPLYHNQRNRSYGEVISYAKSRKSFPITAEFQSKREGPACLKASWKNLEIASIMACKYGYKSWTHHPVSSHYNFLSWSCLCFF